VVIGKGFFARGCNFYIEPGNTYLFSVQLPAVPQQGWRVEYHDIDTGVTTTYSVQDIILQVDELAAVPASPGPPEVPALPKRHVHSFRVEIQVL